MLVDLTVLLLFVCAALLGWFVRDLTVLILNNNKSSAEAIKEIKEAVQIVAQEEEAQRLLDEFDELGFGDYEQQHNKDVEVIDMMTFDNKSNLMTMYCKSGKLQYYKHGSGWRQLPGMEEVSAETADYLNTLYKVYFIDA